LLEERVHFQLFSNAQNEDESKGVVENEKLEHQFSQVKGDLNKVKVIMNIACKRSSSHANVTSTIIGMYITCN